MRRWINLILFCAVAAVSALPNGYTKQFDIKQQALEKAYIGCYNDTLSHDDLPHLAFTNDVINSPRECVDICRVKSFRYAGLQNGKYCFCGNNDVRAFGKSTSCDVRCPGDPDSTCGGQQDNDVYHVSRDSRYLGCYHDDTSGSDMPTKLWEASDRKSAHECVEACADRDFRYAGVMDGGACYCGNGFGSGGAANETECDMRCESWGAENCGGFNMAAVYLTELAYEISAGNIDPSATKLFDKKATGIPLALYTFYPRVRTIVTKSLILHSSTEIKAPIDDITCSEGCYAPCNEIHQTEDMINKGTDLHLRFFYLNLSELPNYTGSHAQRVYVYAQTLVIDSDVTFNFAVSVRAREMFINRAKANRVTTLSSKDLGVDMTGKIPDPEPDLMHFKQSLMCARILYDTFVPQDRNIAWGIVYDIARASSAKPEVMSFISSVRTYAAELSGLPRSDVHFVPYYTKSHISRILEAYSQRVSIYQRELESVEKAVKEKREFIGFVKEMHLIYTTTNIAEAEKSYEAAMDALTKSNATYRRFMEYYEEARVNLEVEHNKFEKALNASRQNSFKKFVRGFADGVLKIGVGVVRIVLGDIPGGVGDILGGVDTLFDTMYNLAAAMREIKQLMQMADDILESIAEAEDQNEMMKYLDSIELMVQLEVNVVRWQNLKHFGAMILEDEEVVEIEGCAEYKRALLDFCNWGEALTKSMVESAALMREAMEKKMLLKVKQQQRERILENFDKFDNAIIGSEPVLWDMIEQTYDVRLDLNHALLMFCQAFFYENMKDCSAEYKPVFGGSLPEVQLRINAAKRDGMFKPGGGSTLARIVNITDSDKNPECIDATKCPVNYLRKNRILFLNLTKDNNQLFDVDGYKVARINLTFVGARALGNNKYLKVGIESSGDFQGVKDDVTYNFLTRALSLTYEYNIVSGHVSIYADVYAPYRNIVHHVTPFTTWVMRISRLRSADIDLSHVTHILMGLDGYGNVKHGY